MLMTYYLMLIHNLCYITLSKFDADDLLFDTDNIYDNVYAVLMTNYLALMIFSLIKGHFWGIVCIVWAQEYKGKSVQRYNLKYRQINVSVLKFNGGFVLY